MTLRIYVPVSQIAGAPFAIAYPMIAWLGWVPNMLIAEAYVHWRRVTVDAKAAIHSCKHRK